MNLQNLLDYCKDFGIPDPFSAVSVPAPLNMETVRSAIIVRCGLLTPLYAEPEVFTNLVNQWFESKQWTFEHLINIIEAKYSPIENYDRYTDQTAGKNTSEIHSGGYEDNETGEDVEANSGKDTVKDSGTDSESNSGKDQRDITNSGTDTTTNTISAYNSSSYQPDNKSETTHGHKVDDDLTFGKKTDMTYGKQSDTTYGRQVNTRYGKKVTHNYLNDTISHTGSDTLTEHIHGCIGVTTNQQLIEQELKLLQHFDIYSYIANLFENDNMIMIY